MREDVKTQLRAYVDLRIKADALSTVEGEWRVLSAEAARIQTALWDQARRAAELAPNPVTSGLFHPGAERPHRQLSGRRDAALNRHVPEIVLWLLFATFLISGLIVGFAAGVGGRRPSWATFAMVTLILVLVFVILDLDRRAARADHGQREEPAGSAGVDQGGRRSCRRADPGPRPARRPASGGQR